MGGDGKVLLLLTLALLCTKAVPMSADLPHRSAKPALQSTKMGQRGSRGIAPGSTDGTLGVPRDSPGVYRWHPRGPEESPRGGSTSLPSANRRPGGRSAPLAAAVPKKSTPLISFCTTGTIDGVRFEGNEGLNSTSGGGGAALVLRFGVTVDITNSEFIDNSSSLTSGTMNGGGAIWGWTSGSNPSNTLSIDWSTFSGNESAENAGAAWLYKTNTTMGNVLVHHQRLQRTAPYDFAYLPTELEGLTLPRPSSTTGGQRAASAAHPPPERPCPTLVLFVSSDFSSCPCSSSAPSA